MPWDAFCDEHYDVAMKRLKEKFGKGRVGSLGEHTTCDDDEDVEPITCGYPDCSEEPTKEIIWLEEVRDIGDSSKYVPLR